MSWSRKISTAYSSIPAWMAVTSSGLSGLQQSMPATSPTKTGWSWRIATRIRLAPLMAHEINAVELVAEGLAGGERGLEIILSQHIGVDLLDGHDCGVARLAADQRYLAEEIAGPETRDLPVGAVYLDLTFGHQEELLTGLALADNGVARGEMALGLLFRDVRELARRQGLEQIDRTEEFADPQCIVQHHVRHDPAIDHVHQAVGRIDDPMVVGDHHDRRTVLDGCLLE